MQETSTLKRWQITTLIVVGLFVFPICGVVFSQRSNPYKRTANSQTQLVTNPNAILDILPKPVYDQTVSSLKNYFTSSGGGVPDSMTIKDSVVKTLASTYTFTLTTNSGRQEYPVILNVSNYDGTLSTLVTVDGQTQNIQSAPSGTRGTPVNNIDVLLNLGMSSVQNSLLLQAFETYMPNADQITLATSTINTPPPDDNGVSTASFNVTIDSKQYKGIAKYGLDDSLQLILSDMSGKQLFDSGKLGGS